MKIKLIKSIDKDKAFKLVIDTFLRFEAQDYGEEGINTFKTLLHDNEFIKSLEMYGAFDGEDLIGVIATRNSGSHIVLLFVDGNHHRKGIAKELFNNVLKQFSSEIITVNSSPYAINAYKRLGFTATKKEQIKDGIRFTPMIYKR